MPTFKVVAEHGAHIFKIHEKAERPNVYNADLEGLQRHELPAAMSSCSRVRAALGLSPCSCVGSSGEWATHLHMETSRLVGFCRVEP